MSKKNYIMANFKEFKKNYLIGYKDENGNVVIEPKYTGGPYSWSKYACVSKGTYCGAIDENGNEIIPLEYEDINYLFDNLFAVRKKEIGDDWSFGVIDSNNKVIIPFEYKYISNLGKFIQCCKKATSKRKSYSSSAQQFEYNALQDVEWLNSSCESLYKGSAISSQKSYLIVGEDLHLGAIDLKGDLVVPIEYEEIHCAGKDRFIVRTKYENSWRFGVISNQNAIIIPFEYKFITSENGDFYECYKDASCKRNYKSQINPYEYDDKKKVCWYNNDGLKICENDAKILSSKYLGVCSNGKWGIYNQSNNRIINFLYDDVALLQNKFVVYKDGYVGILEENGVILIDNSYSYIECVSQEDVNYGGYLEPKTYGRYSKENYFDSNKDTQIIHRKKIYYDKRYNGNWRIGFSSSESSYDFDAFFILSNKSYSELFSLKEGILADSRFDKIEQLTNISFAVRRNDKWGVYRADISELIIECEYDRIIFEGGHIVLLEKGGLWGAKTLDLPSHILFDKFFDIDVPIKFKEIKVLDKTEQLYGVKVERKNYKDEIVEEYTIVDRKGESFKEMSHFSYLDKQCIIFNSNFDRILASRKNKFGFISADGYVAIPYQYDEILLREDGNFDVRINKAWGIIDISGKEIAGIKYSERLPKSLSNKIVQNVFTNRYGVLSSDGTELAPSIYEHIQIKDGLIFFGYNGFEYNRGRGNFFSKVDHATWGCINQKGEVIINPKYDCFKIQHGFLLGGRDGSMLYHHDSDFGSDYSGVFDLYTQKGELLFGGITEFDYNEEKEIFVLFFGGEWVCYSDCVDEWNNITIHDYMFKRGAGLWLFLDKNFKSIIRDDAIKQVSFKKGTICNIEIKKQDKKKTYVYNLPIRVMAKGFSHFEENALVISDYNVEDGHSSARNYSAIEISSGKQSPFYSKIQFINKSTFFFSDEGKVGMANFDNKIIPAEYLFFTEPVHGFFFAAKEIDKEFSSLHLLSINDMSINFVAIEKAKTESIIDYASFERLLLDFDGTSFEIKDIIVSKLEIFDKSFREIISQKESNYWCSRFENCYWFSNDYRMRKEVNTGFYGDDDEPNYAEDTWYALTDGMYGEYPDGDVDYDVFGF